MNCGKVLMALVRRPGRSCGMARRWGGFTPQNLTAKEEWELVESCETQARQASQRESAQQPAQVPIRREEKKPSTVRVLKTKH